MAARTHLRIGEVAALLGVTPKAVRHYHRVGLLAAAERSPSGYRLYTARDLVRLLRIRRLQALGLSLAQVRRVLGEPDQERSLRAVLEDLLAAGAAQIAALEARQARIRALLARASLDVVEHPPETPALLLRAQERLGRDLRQASPDLWQHDAKLFGLLEGFNWPGGHDERLRAAADLYTQRLVEHPEQYERLLGLAERVAALAALPEDAPEVARLADDVLAAGVADLLGGPPGAAPLAAGDADDPYAAILGEVLLGALAPAQRRFVALLHERTPHAGHAGQGGITAS
jgi:DNA-binding transcriptional MerR regulator